MDSRNKCVILTLLMVGRWIKLKHNIKEAGGQQINQQIFLNSLDLM